MLRVNKIDTSVNDNYTVGKSNGFNNDEGDGNYNLLRASYVLGFVIASLHILHHLIFPTILGARELKPRYVK